MKVTKQRWLIIFLLALTCQLSDSADTSPPVMCVTGTFTVGSRAFITCIFNRDISGDHKYNFNVVQYTSSGASSGKYVVLCNWNRKATNGKECQVSNGYSYDEAVTDQLTVEIPEVSRSQVGQYACNIAPVEVIPDSTVITVQTCDLNVTEPKNTIQLPVAVTPQAPERNIEEPKNCVEASSQDDGTAAIIALAVILLIVLLLAAWAWVILILRSRRRNERPADFFRSLLPCLKNGIKKRDPFQPDDDASTTVANRRSMAEMAEMANLLEMDKLDSVSVAVTVLSSTNGKQNRQTQTPIIKTCIKGTQTLKKEQLPVKEWTEDQVREWLMEQTVVKYQSLIDKCVNGAQLLLLNHTTTLKKDMGLRSEDAWVLRDLIIKLIKEDKAQQEKCRAAEQAERDRQDAQRRERDRRNAEQKERDRKAAEQREKDQRGRQEERDRPTDGGGSSKAGS